MYKKSYDIKLTENHLKILGLYAQNKEYYVREVSKLINVSPRTAQLILEDLEKKGVLEPQLKGKIKIYTLKYNETSKDYLILAENYKKICFLESNLVIKEIVTQIYSLIEGIGIIFGSYARNTQKEESDLDLFIVGKYDPKQIKILSKKHNIKINVKNYSIEDFKNLFSKDFLIREVSQNHIIIKNAERYIGVMFENG